MIYTNPETLWNNIGSNYQGHSSLISKVEFTIDDSKLFSCGNSDESIFQWRLDFLYEEAHKWGKDYNQEIKIKDDSLINELNYSYAGTVY